MKKVFGVALFVGIFVALFGWVVELLEDEKFRQGFEDYDQFMLRDILNMKNYDNEVKACDKI